MTQTGWHNDPPPQKINSDTLTKGILALDQHTPGIENEWVQQTIIAKQNHASHKKKETALRLRYSLRGNERERKMGDLSSQGANWVWCTPLTFPKLITGHARPSNYSDACAGDELESSYCSKQKPRQVKANLVHAVHFLTREAAFPASNSRRWPVPNTLCILSHLRRALKSHSALCRLMNESVFSQFVSWWCFRQVKQIIQSRVIAEQGLISVPWAC